MNIALVTDSFLPGIGGTEKVVLSLAKSLSKFNNVLVVAPDYKDNGCDLALPFKVVRVKSLAFTKNDFWATPKLDKNLLKALNEFKPEIIHVHTLGKLCGFMVNYGRKFNIPTIVSIHTKYKYCWKNNLKFSFLANYVVWRGINRARKATVVTAVSESMKTELLSYNLKRDILVIRNGYDVESRIDKKDFNFSKLNLLFVGLVSEIKNLQFTLKALKLAKEKGVDFEFTVVGRGKIEKFTSLSKKLGILDRVKFLGEIKDRDTLNKQYKNAHLILFPSLFDSDGLIVLEGANYGVPSLVIENSGASERIINNVSGFTAPNDVVKYSDKIVELYKNKNLLEGITEMPACKSVEQTAREYFNLYMKVINKK